MKKSFIISLFILVIAAVSLLIYRQKQPVKSQEKLIAEQNLEKTILRAKQKLKSGGEEAEEKAEERERPDEPEKFADFHKMIRTREGESEPAYPPNYKFQELRKARKSLPQTEEVLPWQDRGPGNVSGRTRGLIVDPDDPLHNTWYAGSVGGGVWKTTNRGDSWEDKTPNLPNLATTVLVMAASNHDVIFAGTGEGFFNVDAVAGDGIWKSSDRGETWTQLPATAGNPDFQYVNRMLIDPADENIVLAATNSGIFRSADGGSNWTAVYQNGRRIQQIIANPENFNTLYGTSNSTGILKSVDGGLNWQYSYILSGSGRIEIAMAPTDTARIYAAAQSPTSRLYMTTDAGENWSQVNEQSGSGPNWLGSQGWYDNTITVHPFNENIVFMGGINVWKAQILTGNQRQSVQLTNWYPGAGYPYVHADHHNLVTVVTDSASQEFLLLNANDGGVEFSEDGGSSWNKTLNGYNTTQFYGADKKPGESAYIGGMQDNGTWRSTVNPTPTSPWYSQLGGDGFDVSWNYGDPDKIIGSVQYNSFQRSLDGGLTWDAAIRGLTDVGSGSGIFISALGKSRSDPDLLFAIGSQGVWRSDNFAADWTRSVIDPAWGYNGLSGQVKISQANPQIVWAGNSMTSGAKVQVSTDGGLTFTATSNYTGASLGRLSGMDTHPRDDSTAYVTFSFANAPKILRTTDLGQTWEDLSGFGSGSVSTNGFPDVATFCVLVMPHTPDTLWAGTEIGLFESVDNGATWHFADNGLPAVSIWDMKVVDDEIVVATHGRGIWSVQIPELLNYPPPAVTLSPRLDQLVQGPDGNLKIDIALRSVYDSTQIRLNGQRFVTIFNSTPLDTLINYPVTQSGTVTAFLTAYKDGKTYRSATRQSEVIPLSQPQVTYVNDFNELSNDFTGEGFTIYQANGFDDEAIHSAHPYSNNLNISYQMTVPIIVADIPSEAVVKFDEIAIIEPGDPGSVFGSPDFWDYVIVEATRDGIEWIPLQNGYDARFDADWLTVYNSGTPGTPSLFRTHEMDLSQHFAAGEQILLRFRLYADGAVTGWGWAIDNLRIQENATGILSGRQVPESFALLQNYPNPFNPSTSIQYNLPKQARVKLTVYNSLGQRIKTLVNGEQQPGLRNVVWNGTDNAGRTVASGIYLYRLEAGDFRQTRKMMLLK